MRSLKIGFATPLFPSKAEFLLPASRYSVYQYYDIDKLIPSGRRKGWTISNFQLGREILLYSFIFVNPRK